MLLILVEVSVKVACQFTTSTDCIQRAISMLLILVAVSVKVTCQSSTAIDCSRRATSMIRPWYLLWWKYPWKWLVSPLYINRLQPLSYLHATYFGESICESGLPVHDSHRLQSQSYLHAIYFCGSICESGLSVHDSQRLQPQSYLHATYSGGSIC